MAKNTKKEDKPKKAGVNKTKIIELCVSLKIDTIK
jgi:hypothetical protein